MLSTEIYHGTRAVIISFGQTSSQVNGKIKFRLKSCLEISGRALHHVILVQSACDLLSKLETVKSAFMPEHRNTGVCR